LGRFREAEKYLVEKMHKVMQEHALRSPELKPLYDGVND